MERRMTRVMMLMLLTAAVFAQDDNQLEYTIFEYNGEGYRYPGLFGVPKFSVLIETNKTVAIKEFYIVSIDGFEIMARRDGKNITTIKTLAKYQTSMWPSESISSAVLLVPDEEDKKSWQIYFEKLKRKFRMTGLITTATLKLLNNNFCVALSTKNKHSIGVDEVMVNVNNIDIVVDNEPHHIYKKMPYFTIEWLRYHSFFTGGFSRQITADKLAVHVADEIQGKEWTQRLAEWKEKTKPHRILPPK